MLVLVLVVGCSSPPPPRPTPLPATPTPAVTPYPTLDATTNDIQDQFLTNVNDLTDAIESLAISQCSEISAETSQNPTEVTEMHGFAATLQRLGASQPALSTSQDVQSSLNDLTKALQQLDAALSTCGIRSS
jgi:hypothetical protein